MNLPPPDNVESYWELFQYVKARTQRRLNKLIGRPATPGTAILAAMVSGLRKATQTWLGDDYPITGAALSSPDNILLTDEEINDVLDYLKLENFMVAPIPRFEMPHFYDDILEYLNLKTFVV